MTDRAAQPLWSGQLIAEQICARCSTQSRPLELMRAKPELVAIVEDDEAMRTSIERLLQASGYVTEAFESAEQFLRSTALDGAIGLVLDVNLGGMSGIDLRRHLIAARSKLPVVFITAHDVRSARAEAMQLGCLEYLQKPFEADLLIQALKRGKAFKS